jgi:hypothetical protein
MSCVPIYNMNIVQGANFTLTVTFSARDLTGYTARTQGRTSFDDNQTVFDWTTANGYLAISYSAPDSTLTITATAAQTAALGAAPHGQAHGIEGVYDLEIVSPGGVVERAFQGTFSVLPEVTR